MALKHRTLKFMIIIITSAIVSLGLNLNILAISVLGFISGILMMLALVYFGDEKISDERLAKITHMSSDITIRIYGLTIALISFVMIFDENLRIAGYILLMTNGSMLIMRGVLFKLLLKKHGN